jgi:hypothetical protein
MFQLFFGRFTASCAGQQGRTAVPARGTVNGTMNGSFGTLHVRVMLKYVATAALST